MTITIAALLATLTVGGCASYFCSGTGTPAPIVKADTAPVIKADPKPAKVFPKKKKKATTKACSGTITVTVRCPGGEIKRIEVMCGTPPNSVGTGY